MSSLCSLSKEGFRASESCVNVKGFTKELYRRFVIDRNRQSTFYVDFVDDIVQCLNSQF